MKRIVALICILSPLLCFAEPVHPSLFLSENDVEIIRQQISDAPSEHVALLSNELISKASLQCNDAKPLEYKLDASGRRILAVSREALLRISANAFAYRVCGERKFFDLAVRTMNEVCSFKDWNTSHYLDTSEMALAVAVGYDWLYNSLSAGQQAFFRSKLLELAIGPSLSMNTDNGIMYQARNNWNQVCNCGILSAAVALCDADDSVVQELLARALQTNAPTMKLQYSPDGNYPEGAGYWLYGTCFQVLMLKLMDDVFGSDFGLSQTPGFDRTAEYMLYVHGCTGLSYNYSDNSPSGQVNDAMWYFADRFKKPELLYREIQALKENRYQLDRYTALFMGLAAKSAGIQSQKPSQPYWCGRGDNPVVLIHTDWTGSETDKFLGIKAGRGTASHGHLDAGSFVYEAYGVRWSCEPKIPAYEFSEVELGKVGKSLWDASQTSGRWQILSYNNLSHSTITVNDAFHINDGQCEIVEEINSNREMGAVLDMKNVFGDQVERAVRTVKVVDNKDLVIIDELSAPADKDVRLRWNFTTKAQPRLEKKGIVLSENGVEMRLLTDGKVEYRIWSSDPADYPLLLADFQPKLKGISFCGYETVIPAGKTVSLKTTLGKIR